MTRFVTTPSGWRNVCEAEKYMQGTIYGVHFSKTFPQINLLLEKETKIILKSSIIVKIKILVEFFLQGKGWLK